ncbi:ABC transporter ATP-binding protein [Methanoculleus sp. FWC-SCC1]|uniref:Molybdate/tungstate import ATP-binding protein WtpC n=1 Tax=Methanoculleus frigidifontis TaxID=2584085 RepID=A0ABT8MCD9_9EURY|nr:tungstate ABC transporter ATP-binding protein WtpC [Methanoculleus sp. FWC-SCC1]MDN7025609.1 ABC transporter ATP-binding protein [Methanoculleus sp. FWC-SCC1]
MLQIANVSKDMGEFFLDNVSLEIQDGEYLVIIGPTGAGKTILLETVAGIYESDSGEIYLDGREITDAAPRDRNICMVYQDYMLFPHLTVEENIGFGLKSKKVPAGEIREAVMKYATMLNIAHLLHRYPGTLSGGEQQRAAIARAMVMSPRALLLDEPLSALDAKTRELLRRELKSLHAITKTTVIHITHNFEEVFDLADRVAIMNQGRIVQVGKPEEIFRKPKDRFVADFVGATNVFKGVSTVTDGLAVVTVDGLEIRAHPAEEGDVYVSVRPEDILISTEPLASPVRNAFPGTIRDVLHVGAVVRLTVDAGTEFIVALTRQGFEETGLDVGDGVYIAFKATAAHVFPGGNA